MGDGMTDQPQFIIDYLDAYRRANPGISPPAFKGPSPGGWWSMLDGHPELQFRRYVRKSSILKWTLVLNERVERLQGIEAGLAGITSGHIVTSTPEPAR
jgi:hypothetical protein